MNDEKIIEKIHSKIITHPLTSRAMDDCCTDGYDVQYVLLAQSIFNIVKTSLEEKHENKS